jgi:Phytanoyl-CoA dioxygenase (PhyH)
MQLTPQELEAGRLAPATLELAIDQVRNNGYVLFERALPDELVSDMQASFLRLLEAHVATADPNRGTNRYQMHVPFAPPFCDERVIASPFVLPIVEALLGTDCICHYMASDTPLPGSDYQDAHPDIFPLFPDSGLVLPPYSIVLNVPLVDAREDNGPLEVWPGGTHHYVARPARVPTLAATMPSSRLTMPAGSLLIRDSRMWHRGTPNRSDAPRPNFALVYSRFWLRLRYRPIPIPRATYDGLSPRAQRLFRLEHIGADADTQPDLEPARFYS